MPRTVSGQVVLDYLDKFPTLPSMTLARLIYKENKALFRTVEAARCSVRQYRGKIGSKNKNEVANTKHYSDKIIYAMPESDAGEYTPYALQDGKWLIMADLHLPYHCIKSVKSAIAYAKSKKVKNILLLGDVMDHYQLSKFLKDPRMKNFAEEIKTFKQFIRYLKQEFPKGKIIFKMGNHDARYEQYLFLKAPELAGIDCFSFKNVIESDKLGVELVNSDIIIDAGKLAILHGHEYQGGTSSPVNAARTMQLKAKSCTLSGHCHRTSSQIEKTITDKQIASWTVGCLSELHPKWNPLNSWNNGFAILNKSDDNFSVENKRLLNGSIYE